jgi:hypothetical protein
MSENLCDNVKILVYVGAIQATDANMIRRMCFVCWIPKATDTHSECAIPIAFRGKNGYANVSQCCVVLTMPVLLCLYDMHVLILGAN